MTTDVRDGATRRPLKLFTGVLHLAALGLLGVAMATTSLVLLVTGFGLLPAFGVGALVLIGAVYVMYAATWVETRRVAGLYRLSVPDLSFARQTEPGFVGYLRAMWRQLGNGRMWRAYANLWVGSLIGVVILALLQEAIRQLMNRDSTWMVLFDVPLNVPTSGLVTTVVVVGSLVAVVLLTLLHRTLSIAIIDGGANEAELRDKVRSTTKQREGAVRAADVERTRIERDLHDGVQPRLVSIGMTLGLAKETLESDPEGAKKLLDEAHTSTKAAVTELRQLARGIHASVLDDRGLDAALSALVSRSHFPVQLDSRIEGAMISRESQTAVYFAIAEALTNAAKHSNATEARVSLRLRSAEGQLSQVWARIEDNGVGGATVQPGGGLDGIVNRITAAGGSTRIESPVGGPTTIEVSVPCAS